MTINWEITGQVLVLDEIFYYIGANVDAVKDDIALMVADIPVPAKIQEYAATSMELKTKDEIFSAMVVYGFLNYSKGYISIPNKELMDKFAEVIQREPSLGNVYKLAKESGRMLAATKSRRYENNGRTAGIRTQHPQPADTV